MLCYWKMVLILMRGAALLDLTLADPGRSNSRSGNVQTFISQK